MIFSFYIYSQYLWLVFPISPQYCQHLDRQLTYPLTPTPPPTKKKQTKKKQWQPPPLTPYPICWFLMFICCAISYWQPCVNLECTSDQMLQEQSKIPTSESNRYIFYKILIVDCTVPSFFLMFPTFWRVGAPGPQNWNSWLEHWYDILLCFGMMVIWHVVYQNNICYMLIAYLLSEATCIKTKGPFFVNTVYWKSPWGICFSQFCLIRVSKISNSPFDGSVKKSKPAVTVFTLSIGTPWCYTILVLKFEHVYFILLDEW